MPEARGFASEQLTVERLMCALCTKSLEVPSSTPDWQVVTKGKRTDFGPYLGPWQLRHEAQQHFFTGKLFVLVADTHGLLTTHRFHLTRDYHPIAAARYLAPDFGLGQDKVFWVCKHCVYACADEPIVVHRKLQEKIGQYQQLLSLTKHSISDFAGC